MYETNTTKHTDGMLHSFENIFCIPACGISPNTVFLKYIIYAYIHICVHVCIHTCMPPNWTLHTSECFSRKMSEKRREDGR